jgi:serine/threonine protein kinase
VIGVGATLCERFTLDRELGRGGMGTVYRATDQVLGRNVAITFLKDSRTDEEADRIRHRTDLYSVGVMLYECATGDVPFEGDARSVMRQHAEATPAAPRLKNPEIWSTLRAFGRPGGVAGHAAAGKADRNLHPVGI